MSKFIKIVANHHRRIYGLDLHVIEEMPNLSWRAKGMHTYLISRPPEWVIREKDLINRADDSKYAMREALKELENKGLLSREQDRTDGKFSTTIFCVYDQPVGANTVNGNPVDGKLNPIGKTTDSNKSNNDINTSTKYLNEPSGSMKPPKQKPQPIQPDPYQCMTPKRTDPPLVKSVQIPKHIAPIVERWFEVGRRHGPTTKVLRDGVRAVKGVLAGTFFDKPGYRNQIRYSQAEVLRSLDTFNLKRNSPDHQPIKKDFLKDLNLADFFYSQYARNGNGNGGGSIFLQCLEGRAVPAVECHPELTAFALDKYEDGTGKTLDHAGAARIANKMMRYWNEKDEWLKQRGIATPKRLVVAWFGMLESRRGGDWDAGNVLSQNAVGAFESYLKEQHTGR